MKEYGKVTLSLLVAAAVAIVLAGALFSAIPIIQQKANAQSSQFNNGVITIEPGITSSGGGESPSEDTSGLHAIIPALKSSSHSDDASKK